MPICKDPSVTLLNKFGYNVVKLPRKGIEPMDLIGRDQTTEWLGPIDAVWSSTKAKPEPGAPQSAADVSGQRTDKLELSIGLRVLENALSAFGAKAPSLKSAFSRAKKVQFTYTGVTSTQVAPLEAGNYLSAGDLNTENPVVSHYFLEDNAQAYLLFDILKSKSISVTAFDEDGKEVDADVPAIQGIVGASVGITAEGQGKSTLAFEGAEPVSFGFKALAINFVNGRWKLEGAKPSGALAFGVVAADEDDSLDPVLLQSDGLLRLKADGDARLH